jgi:hypothetical protein
MDFASRVRINSLLTGEKVHPPPVVKVYLSNQAVSFILMAVSCRDLYEPGART